jgi:LysR family hydrogen peroxide-inducible transcriptional activator
MNNLTLKQLRYFDALTRHRHFGRAAEACSVTQPALSVQIRELEDALGAPLIDRSNRQVRLTGFGSTFAPRVHDILCRIDDLSDLARSAQTRLAGRFRLGVIPTVAPYFLPRLIGQLTRTHPDLDLRVRETVTPRLISDLNEGHLDAAIMALPSSEPQLTEIALLEEQFVLVRPAADAEKPVPGPKGLRHMKLLLLEEGHCFRDQALSFCNMPSARPNEMLDGSSLTTLVQMVSAGMGVTLLPEMAVPVETGSARVSVSRFQGTIPKRKIGMIWRRSSPLTEQLQDIAQSIRQM